MLPPVRRFLDAGVRVALGTDGRVSNPDLCVRTEARELVGAGVVSPREALGMMTRDAAWALGLERVAGTIATGRPADLVVVGLPDAADPLEGILHPDAPIRLVLRGGRPLVGALPGQAG